MKGKPNFGLWYDRLNNFTAYSDADWVGIMDNTKSIGFFHGGILVYWLIKKQYCTSQSIAKEEYAVVVANNCNQIMCMKLMLKDIGI